MLERVLTAEEFIDAKPDLPEAGRWHELVRGRVVDLQPPSVEHTTVVFNFSKALGQFLEKNPLGYACYELGLLVSRNPDTVRVPAVSFFTSGERFAELDSEVTERVPDLIFDVLSTPRRRESMPQRLREYFRWGVREVWVADPDAQNLRVYTSPTEYELWAEDATVDVGRIHADSPLQGFTIRVSDLFREPEWWTR